MTKVASFTLASIFLFSMLSGCIGNGNTFVEYDIDHQNELIKKLNIKPTPEWYFTVKNEEGQTKQVHAKNVHRIESQKELRALLMEQVHVVVPTVKANDFYEILKNLFFPEEYSKFLLTNVPFSFKSFFK